MEYLINTKKLACLNEPLLVYASLYGSSIDQEDEESHFHFCNLFLNLALTFMLRMPICILPGAFLYSVRRN
jgi:hypothetical protein